MSLGNVALGWALAAFSALALGFDDDFFWLNSIAVALFTVHAYRIYDVSFMIIHTFMIFSLSLKLYRMYAKGRLLSKKESKEACS